MEDNNKQANVVINVSGGTNQILPNATEATQYIYGGKLADELTDQSAPKPAEAPATAVTPKTSSDPELSDDAIRLRRYVESGERLIKYIEDLRVCETATDLAEVVVKMKRQEPHLTSQDITKERFINIVKALAPEVSKGNTVSNIRARITAVEQGK